MEVWKKIPRFNNEYEISSLGKIRSLKAVIIRSNGKPYTRKSKVLKPDTKHSGYCIGAVRVNKKMMSYKIHRLVAEMFIPNPEKKPTVNHINGVKSDNRVENLEWNTMLENVRHAHENGHTNVLAGENVGNSVATEKQVLEIRKYVKKQRDIGNARYGRQKLCDRMGLSVSCVKDIILGRSWKHLL
jgi:hypothetical protein